MNFPVIMETTALTLFCFGTLVTVLDTVLDTVEYQYGILYAI